MTPYSPTPDKDHTKNMAIALVMCALLIVGWQYYVEVPRKAKLVEWQKQQRVIQAQKAEAAKREALEKQGGAVDTVSSPASDIPAPRVAINSDTLHGSVSLKGLRMDMLTLAQYKETQQEDSPEVTLLNPSSTAQPYFMQFGWLSDDTNLVLPGANTIWQSSQSQLTPDKPLVLEWNNEIGRAHV